MIKKIENIKHCFCITLVLFTTSLFGDWSQYRGENYDGICTESIDYKSWGNGGPSALWEAEIGVGFSGCTVVDGRVFIMGNIGENIDVVTCLSEKTGKVIWTKKYKCELQPKFYEGGPGATPTVYKGQVFTLSKFGDVLCLDGGTGKVVWQRNLVKAYGCEVPAWGFSGSVVVYDDQLLVNVFEYGCALSIATGKLLWKTGNAKSSYATHLPFKMGGKNCMAIFAAKSIAIIDHKVGKVLKEYKWETNYDVNAADPIPLPNDQIFISSDYGKGCGVIDFSGDNGKLVWGHKKVKSQFMAPVIWEGYIYCLTEKSNKKGKLVCLDPKTGDIQWEEKISHPGTIFIAKDKLVNFDGKGKLSIVALNPKKYELLASASLLKGRCWTTPTLANGNLYVRNAKGKLICYKVQ